MYFYLYLSIVILLYVYLFIYLYCIYSVCVRMGVTSSSMYCVDLLTDCTLPMVKSIYIHILRIYKFVRSSTTST